MDVKAAADAPRHDVVNTDRKEIPSLSQVHIPTDG